MQSRNGTQEPLDSDRDRGSEWASTAARWAFPNKAVPLQSQSPQHSRPHAKPAANGRRPFGPPAVVCYDGVLAIGVKHPERRRSAQMNRKSGHGRAGWEESNPDGMCVVES